MREEDVRAADVELANQLAERAREDEAPRVAILARRHQEAPPRRRCERDGDDELGQVRDAEPLGEAVPRVIEDEFPLAVAFQIGGRGGNEPPAFADDERAGQPADLGPDAAGVLPWMRLMRYCPSSTPY